MERKLIFLLFIIMYNFGYTQNFIFILSPGDEAFNKGNFKEAIKYYKLTPQAKIFTKNFEKSFFFAFLLMSIIKE